MNSPLNIPIAELVARRFLALSDPTRLRIIDHLRGRGEASVRELTAALETSQQNVSNHLGTLLAEGFVSRRKRGTSSIYEIADPAVLELCERVCGGVEARHQELSAALGQP